LPQFNEITLKLLVQNIEHGDRLLGGTRFPAANNTRHCGHLIIDANRIVERILSRLIFDLVHLGFHLGDFRIERRRQRFKLCGVGRIHVFHAIGELCADVAHSPYRVVRIGRAITHLHQQLVLRDQIRRRGFRARIFLHDELRVLRRTTVDDQSYRVRTWNDEWACGPCGPIDHAVKTCGIGLAQIPREGVHARLVANAWFWWTAKAIITAASDRRNRCCIACKAPNSASRRIAKFDGDFLCCLAEPVVHDGTGRWIRARCVATTTAATKATIPRNAIRRTRRVQMRRLRD